MPSTTASETDDRSRPTGRRRISTAPSAANPAMFTNITKAPAQSPPAGPRTITAAALTATHSATSSTGPRTALWLNARAPSHMQPAEDTNRALPMAIGTNPPTPTAQTR
ncbi:hypothetical protein ASG00_05125 [Microbacterium sp. Leaf351]|nr:hypothetical protein ASG00_05125 [Microbacterium sp. Leaf351]